MPPLKYVLTEPDGLEIILVRRCRRCKVTRSIGHFNRTNWAGKSYRARACNVCRESFFEAGGHPLEGAARFYWPVARVPA